MGSRPRCVPMLLALRHQRRMEVRPERAPLLLELADRRVVAPVGRRLRERLSVGIDPLMVEQAHHVVAVVKEVADDPYDRRALPISRAFSRVVVREILEDERDQVIGRAERAHQGLRRVAHRFLRAETPKEPLLKRP